MRTLIATFTLALFTTPVFAAKTYQMKIDWSVEGMPKTTANIITKENESAFVKRIVKDKEYFLEVLPQTMDVSGKEAIRMDFKVGTIAKNGERTIASTPQVITNPNEVATITVGDSKTKSEVTSISVLATQK